MKHIAEDEPRTFNAYQKVSVTDKLFAKANPEGLKEIPYKPEWDEFENPAEVREAGKWPNDADIVDMVNTKVKTAAVAKSYQAAVLPFKAAFDDSPAKARKDFIEGALKSPQIGGDVAKAEALADSLGFTG